MVKVALPGVAKVRAKGKDYYYAWRGGPRLDGKPGSPEFVASYAAAHANRKPTDDGRLKALISEYRDSRAFKKLAASTRKEWTRRLDRISDHFGTLPVAAFDRTDKIKPLIKAWLDQWEDRPREALYAKQVLSRLLGYAVTNFRLKANPCEGIKLEYAATRADIIWTDEDLASLKAVAPPEVWWVVNIAACTGLRAGDLKRLSWSHVGELTIEIPTDKSRGLKEAVVPLYGKLREALEQIPKRSTLVLTNTKGLPWKAGVNGSSFENARNQALGDKDLHFHDLRGTAATRFHAAGLSNKQIAEIMAWDEAHVEKIIRRYVGKKAIYQGIIDTLNRTETGT